MILRIFRIFCHAVATPGCYYLQHERFCDKETETNLKILTTAPKRDVYIVLSYLGLQSKIITKQLKSCTYNFYGCINLKVIFRNTHRINSFFPYMDRLNRSLKSKVVYKASCWDCDGFYIGKTNRCLHDRKTEHFKALTKSFQASAILDHITLTGHNIK